MTKAVKPSIKTITDEIKAEIVTAAYKFAVSASESGKRTPQQRWHSINSQFQDRLGLEIATRYPEAPNTQHRRLWMELVLQSFGLEGAGFNRSR